MRGGGGGGNATVERLVEATAGAAGQLAAAAALYPLDALKARLQADLSAAPEAAGAAAEEAGTAGRAAAPARREGGAAGRADGPRPRKDEAEEEEEAKEEAGGRGLADLKAWLARVAEAYEGLGAKARAVVCSQFAFFYAYAALKQRHARRHGGRAPGPLEGVLLGVGAGAVNVLLTQPLDTAVSVAQTRRSLRASGTKLQAPGAYAALPVSLLLTLNPGIQYYVFEALKARLLRGRRRALTLAEAFAAGAVAKAAATVATYPAIRAKTLCQSAAGGRFRGFLHALASVLEVEGLAGLYKGMRPVLLKGVLGAALGLAIKEKVAQGQRAALALLARRRAGLPGVAPL